MQPVIEVQCPFCKARGQIVTPPLGAIIVGPCPRCNELVLLFCGAVLPLDKDIILQATPDEKKSHLTDTIMELVVNRIEELVDNAEGSTDEPLIETDDVIAEAVELAEEAVAEAEDAVAEAGAASVPAVTAEAPTESARVPSVATDGPVTAITDQEVQDFLNIDLHLIDRKQHFDRVFGET